MEDADFDGLRMAAAALAIAAFNVPILITALSLRKVTGFNQVLREKAAACPPEPGDDDGASTGPLSYSRVTGLIGAVVLASLFWMLSNVVIATAILEPKNLTLILANVGTLFYVGAALFLPYGFNQIKALLQ